MIRALCDECDAFEKDTDHLAEQYEALLREKDAEIERLRAENAVYANGVEEVAKNYHQQGRAEAIDEFVDGCVEMAIGIGNIPVVCLESILKFAEKMKGEIYGNKQGKTSKP